MVKKLSELFNYLENIQHTDHYANAVMKDDDSWSMAAPFTHLGSDCFSDVDHKDLAWELRRY